MLGLLLLWLVVPYDVAFAHEDLGSRLALPWKCGNGPTLSAILAKDPSRRSFLPAVNRQGLWNSPVTPNTGQPHERIVGYFQRMSKESCSVPEGLQGRQSPCPHGLRSSTSCVHNASIYVNLPVNELETAVFQEQLRRSSANIFHWESYPCLQPCTTAEPTAFSPRIRWPKARSLKPSILPCFERRSWPYAMSMLLPALYFRERVGVGRLVGLLEGAWGSCSPRRVDTAKAMGLDTDRPHADVQMQHS